MCVSAEVFHVCLILEESLWVLAQESQIVVLCELRPLRIFPDLRHLAGVDQTVDVGRDPLVPFEVGQAVYQLQRGRRDVCIHLTIIRVMRKLQIQRQSLDLCIA